MSSPSVDYMTLTAGINSAKTTIFTSSLIKVGDTIRITGTASNNGVWLVTQIIDNSSTATGSGATFTDNTCDVSSGSTTVTHDANDNICAGLSVSGTGIASSTYIASIIDNTSFTLSKNAVASATNTTLTFGDNDIFYVLKGKELTNENSAGSTDPQIEIGSPADKLLALGDPGSGGGIDLWSNNAVTNYATNDNGWTTNALDTSPSSNRETGSKNIFYYVDGALRACNTNLLNNNVTKWFGYIQKNQFSANTGLVFTEWQEHLNTLSPPASSGGLTFSYGTTSHTASTATNYYQNNRGVVKAKLNSTSDLRLDGDHNTTVTGFTFEDTGNNDVLDQAKIGEVITIGDALGAYPVEFLFCKKTSGASGVPITYSRAYGGALIGTAPATHSDHDTPILERGLGFNIGVDAGTGDGDWLPVTYEFYQSFVYDNNQESLPVKMGNGASSIAKFEHDHSSSAGKAIQVSVYSDLAYNGRINGGRVYIRESNSDNDLTLLVDIDIEKGVRTSIDGDHNPWSYEAGKGYYVTGNAAGNSKTPNIDTYTTINGFASDVNSISLGGNNETYQAVVVANRRTFVANVRMKALAGNVTTFGDRIMYSEINKFDTFLEHNFIDVAKGDYGDYTALEFYADRLIAFKHNLVHIINIANPSPSSWYLEDTIRYYGVSFPHSVCKTNYGIAWANEAGCFLYSGDRVTDLINKKIGISKSSATITVDDSQYFSDTWHNFVTGSANVKDVMVGYDAKSNSLIIIRSPNDQTTNSDTAWLYDFDSGGWVYHGSDDNVASPSLNINDSLIMTNFITDYNQNLVTAIQRTDSQIDNDYSTTLMQFYKFLPISTNHTNQSFVTKDIDFNSPGLRKKVYGFVVNYKTSGTQTNPFSYSIDSGANFVSAIGSLLNTSDTFDVLNITFDDPVECNSIQIRYAPVSSIIIEISDITIEYRILRNKQST